MKLSARGKNISEVEVQDVSQRGIWLLVRGREYYLPYKDYPWFKNARLSQVFHVDLIGDSHLHWPDLDVDIELNCIGNLVGYPLVYR
jgi:hypothetical protein